MTVLMNMKMKMLLVDDCKELRSTYARLFRRQFEVTLAADVDEALEHLKVLEPDVIVSDLEMPGLSGLDFFEHVSTTRPDLADRFILFTGAPDKARGQVPRIADKGSNIDGLMTLISSVV